MKTRSLFRPRILAGAILLSLGLFQLGATPGLPQPCSESLPYSKSGHGPSIVLLHDSSLADQRWTKAAQELAGRFEVVLLDVSDIASDSRAAQQLRKMLDELGIQEVRIAGSARAESLVLTYALTFPLQTQSFTLPHNSEDLEILAQLVNSTPLTRS